MITKVIPFLCLIAAASLQNAQNTNELETILRQLQDIQASLQRVLSRPSVQPTQDSIDEVKNHETPPLVVIALPLAPSVSTQNSQNVVDLLKSAIRRISGTSLPEVLEETKVVTTPSIMLPELTISEGEECSRNGVSGVCMELKKCPSALQNLYNGKISEIQICTFKNSNAAVVCCEDRISSTPEIGTTSTTASTIFLTTTTDITSTVSASALDNVDINVTNVRAQGCEPLSPQLTSNTTGQKAWDKCLEYQEKLVYPCVLSPSPNGEFYNRFSRCNHDLDDAVGVNSSLSKTLAVRNEFPHMASIGYGKDMKKLEWLCSGTLISEKFVLSAAHCVHSRRSGPVTYVALGLLKHSDPIKEENLFKIKGVHLHPGYIPPRRSHDIELLELEKEVPLSEFLVPACLHTGDAIDDKRPTVTGWGSQFFRGPVVNDLKKVILKKSDPKLCSDSFPVSRLMPDGLNPFAQLCYEHIINDTCQGDGGAPLQVKSTKISCMYTVLGVTSYDRWCGVPGEPGLYTSVAYYLDWIEKIVWP